MLPPPRDLLTISPAVAAQPQGGPVFLTGRLARANGRRPSGAAVVLQQRLAGAWTDVASVATGVDGIWSASLPLARNGDVRAVAPASGIVSATIPVQVSAGVSVRISSRRPRLGATIELTGTTTPAKARMRLLIERRLQGHRPRFRRLRVRSISSLDGAFAVPLRLPAAGTYRVGVTTVADDANAPGRSRPLLVRVLNPHP